MRFFVSYLVYGGDVINTTHNFLKIPRRRKKEKTYIRITEKYELAPFLVSKKKQEIYSFFYVTKKENSGNVAFILFYF